MSKWRECNLDEVTTIIGDGLHGTPQYEDNGEYYFINGNNLNNGKIVIKPDTNKVNEQEYLKYKKPLSHKTILISINGTIGNVALYHDEKCMLGKSACYINASDTIDRAFLYYVFLDGDFQNYLIETATGTTIPNVPLKGLRKYSFKYPPLPEQKAIAGVFSSLDDKIDLLHQQNKTLEAMAEALFRQWFVEPCRDSLPEGWDEKPLSFFGKIICGKTPSKNIQQYFDGLIPFIKIPDMHGNTFLFRTSDSLTETGKLSQDNKTLPPKSICVSCIATVGLVSMNAIESQSNQQINSIIPYEDYYRYFLYLTMKTSCEQLQAMASGGTATLNLNTGDFSNIPILCPNTITLMDFNNKLEHIFDKIFHNQYQIFTIEKLRDTLLPKLMSGEVRVEL